jgi:hypothetical protein
MRSLDTEDYNEKILKYDRLTQSCEGAEKSNGLKNSFLKLCAFAT